MTKSDCDMVFLEKNAENWQKLPKTAITTLPPGRHSRSRLENPLSLRINLLIHVF
jgi:hypothetical protein